MGSAKHFLIIQILDIIWDNYEIQIRIKDTFQKRCINIMDWCYNGKQASSEAV